MTTVNRETLVSRLQSLNASQQSIEGNSKWCIFYNKDAKSVANIWLEELTRAPGERRVAFFYLANHILQVRLTQRAWPGRKGH
jgi:regulator of Ty1 transposition protein 103